MAKRMASQIEKNIENGMERGYVAVIQRIVCSPHEMEAGIAHASYKGCNWT